LLRHPLCLSLIRYKWFKVGRKLYYFNLLFYISFLATLTAYTLTIPNPAEYPVSIFLLEKYHCKTEKLLEQIWIWTRFSGRFAPIFCFNCKNFLFVDIAKQKQKTSRILWKKCRGFSKFYGSRILLEAILRPDRFNRLDVY